MSLLVAVNRKKKLFELLNPFIKNGIQNRGVLQISHGEVIENSTILNTVHFVKSYLCTTKVMLHDSIHRSTNFSAGPRTLASSFFLEQYWFIWIFSKFTSWGSYRTNVITIHIQIEYPFITRIYCNWCIIWNNQGCGMLQIGASLIKTLLIWICRYYSLECNLVRTHK